MLARCLPTARPPRRPPGTPPASFVSVPSPCRLPLYRVATCNGLSEHAREMGTGGPVAHPCGVFSTTSCPCGWAASGRVEVELHSPTGSCLSEAHATGAERRPLGLRYDHIRAVELPSRSARVDQPEVGVASVIGHRLRRLPDHRTPRRRRLRSGSPATEWAICATLVAFADLVLPRQHIHLAAVHDVRGRSHDEVRICSTTVLHGAHALRAGSNPTDVASGAQSTRSVTRLDGSAHVGGAIPNPNLPCQRRIDTDAEETCAHPRHHDLGVDDRRVGVPVSATRRRLIERQRRAPD